MRCKTTVAVNLEAEWQNKELARYTFNVSVNSSVNRSEASYVSDRNNSKIKLTWNIFEHRLTSSIQELIVYGQLHCTYLYAALPINSDEFDLSSVGGPSKLITGINILGILWISPEFRIRSCMRPDLLIAKAKYSVLNSEIYGRQSNSTLDTTIYICFVKIYSTILPFQSQSWHPNNR